jgi:hypothetical protein
MDSDSLAYISTSSLPPLSTSMSSHDANMHGDNGNNNSGGGGNGVRGSSSSSSQMHMHTSTSSLPSSTMHLNSIPSSPLVMAKAASAGFVMDSVLLESPVRSTPKKERERSARQAAAAATATSAQ